MGDWVIVVKRTLWNKMEGTYCNGKNIPWLDRFLTWLAAPLPHPGNLVLKIIMYNLAFRFSQNNLPSLPMDIRFGEESLNHPTAYWKLFNNNLQIQPEQFIPNENFFFWGISFSLFSLFSGLYFLWVYAEYGNFWDTIIASFLYWSGKLHEFA